VDQHVALSVVGADVNPNSGYLRAKTAQEKLINESGAPFTIVRATQFYEFVAQIAGPEKIAMDDFIRTGLAAQGDPRQVVADPRAPYFGEVIDESSIVPGPGATIFTTRFDDWLASSAAR
jgi:uncharacterized protein YbjT (DUF2867 family)